MKRFLGKECIILQRIYRPRALAECVNSIIERRLDSSMRANNGGRVLSAFRRVIAYNPDHVLDIGLVRSTRGV